MFQKILKISKKIIYQTINNNFSANKKIYKLTKMSRQPLPLDEQNDNFYPCIFFSLIYFPFYSYMICYYTVHEEFLLLSSYYIL